MLRPKKNSIKEFDNEKKFLRLERLTYTAKVRFKLRISQNRKQLKTFLIDDKLRETTNLSVEITNS